MPWWRKYSFLVPAEDVDDEDDDLVLRVAQDMFPYSDSGLNGRLDSPSHDEFERSTVQDQAERGQAEAAPPTTLESFQAMTISLGYKLWRPRSRHNKLV